ncbi:hypothetical protein GCM10025777_54130 [Membranihabitans marinus]
MSLPIEYTNPHELLLDLKFNGTVFISKNGQTLLKRGYGQSNRETGIANDIQTQYRIGSVSKTLTGMAVVQLMRDGLINDFDQPISDFDPDFPLGHLITIRQLLSHRSGIPDYLGGVEYLAKAGSFFSPEDIYDIISENIVENGLLFSPGGKTQYSNSNFLIAGLLVEHLTNTSLDQYIEEHILLPLQMTATEIGQNEIDNPLHAQGYNKEKNVSSYPMNIAFGAGDWSSNVEDMALYCAAVMGDSWFTPAEKAEIFDVEVSEGNTGFGLSWFKSNIDGKSFYWHGGDIDGFTALIGFTPESKGIIIALSNQQDDTGKLRNTLIEKIVKAEF